MRASGLGSLLPVALGGASQDLHVAIADKHVLGFTSRWMIPSVRRAQTARDLIAY
jgi:hypothetical protein